MIPPITTSIKPAIALMCLYPLGDAFGYLAFFFSIVNRESAVGNKDPVFV
jgi:hypothetical protein